MTVESVISSTGKPYASTQVNAGRHSRFMAGFRQGIGLPDWRMDAEELETATFRKLLSRRRRENSRSLRPERRSLTCITTLVPCPENLLLRTQSNMSVRAEKATSTN